MEKVWLASYPEGVPTEIDPDRFTSLVDLFEQSVARYGDKPAFINMGKTITYNELDKLSRDFAAYLQQDLKLTSLLEKRALAAITPAVPVQVGRATTNK